MRGGIGKGTDPNHPTHVQKLLIAQDSAQRPYRERDEQEYQCPIAGAMDQLSDRPRIEPNRVGIVNHLAERHEQAHQRNDTEGRYAVAGVAPKFEWVSQRIFPNELGDGVDDNNRRGLLEAIVTRLQPVYVEDVAEAIVRAVQRAETNAITFECGAPASILTSSFSEPSLAKHG